MKRPFPALLIMSLVLLICLFPGQYWIPRLLPGISGLASLDASLIVLDRPIHLPITLDLVVVPALFILLYTLISTLYPQERNLPVTKSVMHRLWSALSATIILLSCVALAGLISYVLDDYLPRHLRKSLDSLGMSADLYLQGYKPAHLQGNIIALLGLVVGIIIAIVRINKPPLPKTAPLTRQQRMTPYQRMLQEKRTNQRVFCSNQPLPALEPEAVSYRPL